MNNNEFQKLDSNFLSAFVRSKMNYFENKDNAILEAYKSGIYDAMVNFAGESNLKITGTSRTIEEVKKYLRQISYNAELTLRDNNHNLIKTMHEQELLVESWFKTNSNESQYTQLILMISKDNNRNKLLRIAHDFFEQKFANLNYIYVEHTDTDTFHYHVIVEADFNDDNLLLKLRSDFFALCIKHRARLL